jgi:hypothetical protein
LCRNEAGTFGWAVSLKHSRIISGDSGPPAVACFNGISRNGAETHLKEGLGERFCAPKSLLPMNSRGRTAAKGRFIHVRGPEEQEG